MDGEIWGRLAYLSLLLMAVGGWVIVEYRNRMGQALRTLAAWALIFIGIAAGYGLWQDIRRDVIPRQSVSTSGEIALKRAADGHFYVELMIDAVPVFFMVDTGATNMVLSNHDATRLGLDPETLLYSGQASTANGVVRTARVSLDKVVLGPFEEDRFSAYVNDGEMEGSLLGMDYLRRFSIRIEGDRMVLAR